MTFKSGNLHHASNNSSNKGVYVEAKLPLASNKGVTPPSGWILCNQFLKFWWAKYIFSGEIFLHV